MESFKIINNIILASVLEPIPEKKGCTTRNKDWQDKSKLEYFLIAGVNISTAFNELIIRIVDNNYKQPPLIYDLAYKAQNLSLKNRFGGKVNFGIIELLIPIVATQIIYQDFDITVLDKVENVLKNTTKEDVRWHLKFRELARSVSKKLPNVNYYDVKNMYEYYRIDKNNQENDIHNEYIEKFSRIKEAYNILSNDFQDGELLNRSVIAYDTIIEKCNNYYGLAADYICVAIYLFLSKYPDSIIV